MGCGCGGSKPKGGATTATRRGGGSEQAKPKATGGFTWNGPSRPETKSA